MLSPLNKPTWNDLPEVLVEVPLPGTTRRAAHLTHSTFLGLEGAGLQLLAGSGSLTEA